MKHSINAVVRIRVRSSGHFRRDTNSDPCNLETFFLIKVVFRSFTKDLFE